MAGDSDHDETLDERRSRQRYLLASIVQTYAAKLPEASPGAARLDGVDSTTAEGHLRDFADEVAREVAPLVEAADRAHRGELLFNVAASLEDDDSTAMEDARAALVARARNARGNADALDDVKPGDLKRLRELSVLLRLADVYADG
jgi:hypothetical protein